MVPKQDKQLFSIIEWNEYPLFFYTTLKGPVLGKWIFRKKIYKIKLRRNFVPLASGPCVGKTNIFGTFEKILLKEFRGLIFWCAPFIRTGRIND